MVGTKYSLPRSDTYTMHRSPATQTTFPCRYFGVTVLSPSWSGSPSKLHNGYCSPVSLSYALIIVIASLGLLFILIPIIHALRMLSTIKMCIACIFLPKGGKHQNKTFDRPPEHRLSDCLTEYCGISVSSPPTLKAGQFKPFTRLRRVNGSRG